MMMSMLHPWNEAIAATLARDLSRIPHALLIAGPRGLGKNDLAVWLAQSLLCLDPKTPVAPCGHCQSCQLFASHSHPDLHVVLPEQVYKNSSSLLAQYAHRYPPEDKSQGSKESTVIRIDQIRALILSSQTSPQISARKVFLLSPADTLNTNAANSLLKLLEEPPPGSHLLLVADRPSRLPATIRSRCTRVDLHFPNHPEAVSWLNSRRVPSEDVERLLALAGGAPLEALFLAEQGFLAQRDQLLTDLESLAARKADPIACANRWRQFGADRCLHWMQGGLADLIRLRLLPAAEIRHNPDLRLRLQALEKRLDLKQLFHLSETVSRERQYLGRSVDETLLLENLLILWTEANVNG